MTDYKYINPFTDYGFKLIFGTEANKDLLIDFLNCALPFEYPIVDLTFGNVEKTPDTELDRKAIYDINCKNANGDHLIVEMQKGKLAHFKDRALFYLTFPILEMSKKGDWDFRLNEIYYLSLLDFEYEPEATAKVDRYVRLMDQHGEVFYKKLHLKFIQLPAFDKKLVDLQGRYEQWLYFLRNLETFDEIPALFNKDNNFMKVLTLAEIAKLKPQEAKKYKISRMQYLENKGVVDTAYADGRQDGRQEGRQEGIDEMLDLVNKERREKEQERWEKEQAELRIEQERKRSIASIKALIESGVNKQIIAAANNLTIEELDELIKGK